MTDRQESVADICREMAAYCDMEGGDTCDRLPVAKLRAWSVRLSEAVKYERGSAMMALTRIARATLNLGYCDVAGIHNAAANAIMEMEGK